ncbi:MAG: hypothetical protein ACRD0H_22220 [Actinomycetes bacterium]
MSKLVHRVLGSLDHAALVFTYAFVGVVGYDKLDLAHGWHGIFVALGPAVVAAAHKTAATYGSQDN